MKRYEKLAEDISSMISSGVLREGDKLPSVRQACQHFQVSPATVFKAYYLLENNGQIRAKEKSGYFVLPQLSAPSEPTQQASSSLQAKPVSVSDLIFSLMDSVRNRDVVPLGSAFPDPQLFPVQRLAKSAATAMRFMDGAALIADIPFGVLELRRFIAQRYALAGVALCHDDILITTGAMEALNLCLQAVAKSGDYIAIEAPAFYASLQVLQRLQLKAVEIPVDVHGGMDLNVLEQALHTYPIKACWCMPTFQNPTGASMSDEKKQALVSLLRQHQVPLIEDDVYHELYFADHPPKPAKAFDQDGWVMHCSSFSKCLAPGYRIGWVSAGRFSQQVQRAKLMCTISASIPAQMILSDYLQHGGFERHLKHLRQQLQQQYQHMRAAIERYFPKDTEISSPQGGYFLWLKLNPAIDTLQLFEQALAQGISIAPGPMFDVQAGHKHYLRLNFGFPFTDRVDHAVQQLGQLIAAQLIKPELPASPII